jgi:hypothetical protein
VRHCQWCFKYASLTVTSFLLLFFMFKKKHVNGSGALPLAVDESLTFCIFCIHF